MRLPLAVYDAKRGSRQRVVITAGRLREEQVFTIVETRPNDSFGIGETTLAATDTLWKTLSSPGTAFAAALNGVPVELGIFRTAASDLQNFKAACGLK